MDVYLSVSVDAAMYLRTCRCDSSTWPLFEEIGPHDQRVAQGEAHVNPSAVGTSASRPGFTATAS